MRGSLKQRGAQTWLLTLEFGYRRDPDTGKTKRIQKFITFHGTKRQAETRLNDLTRHVQHDTFVEPDKRTVGQWLDSWVDLAIKPPQRTQRAYDTSRSVIALHLKPALGDLRLQGLRVLDVEKLLTDKRETLAPATLEKVFTVLRSALKAAVRSGLVLRNVASAVVNKPRAPEGHSEAVSNCWSAEEAAAFLVVAHAAGPQPAAFFALALNSGLRKSELAGLQWPDVDLAQGRVLVRRQLLTGGAAPLFIQPKGKRARAVELAPETIDRLKAHRADQAALKIRHRRDYHDHGVGVRKAVARPGPYARHDRAAVADQQSRRAGIGAAHRSREGAPHQPSWPAAHVCDPTARRGCALARGAGTARTPENRDDPERVRACPAGPATGCGASPRLAVVPLNFPGWWTNGRQIRAWNSKKDRKIEPFLSLVRKGGFDKAHVGRCHAVLNLPPSRVKRGDSIHPSLRVR
ncbi:MAG: hypothetical protein C5B57_12210 [Blastocatellia bacterium]|nr:MAG: hypothetical protein C5B57_12210 [Blastocatellia bacterium]